MSRRGLRMQGSGRVGEGFEVGKVKAVMTAERWAGLILADTGDT